MEKPNKKSRELRRLRQASDDLDVSYEVSGVSPEKREKRVEAAFDLLFEATLKRMSTSVIQT